MAKIALSGAMFGDDILTHIRVAGEVGYGGIELRGMGPLLNGSAEEEFIHKIEQELNSFNLTPVTFSTWLGCMALRESDKEREAELDRSTAFFSLAQRLNIPHVRVNPSRLPSFEAEQAHWKSDSLWLGKVADRAKEYGVSIYMEMHHGTLADTAQNSLRLIEMIGRDNVGLVFDPYNLFQVPTDYGLKAIRALQSLSLIHI